MSKIEEANEFIRRLQEQRGAYERFTEDRVTPLFLDNDQGERRPPRHFKDSSFLYMRSYDGDNGSRPFSNQVFWLSPDINVSPVSSSSTYTRTLNVGETYNISCVLRNRGDLAVPSAKVELWLTDPSLGFDTRFANHLTLGTVPSAWVSSNAMAVVNSTYTVPPTDIGHKCLFARAFSFAPLDVPIDDFRLDPTIDRHIAQQNLNIVQQGQPFHFNWIHAPNANQVIQFVPMNRDEVLALRHPILAEASPIDEFPVEGWTQMTMVELTETNAEEIEISTEHNSLVVSTRDADSIDLATLREINLKVRQVLTEIHAGETHMADHRELFAKYREVNSHARRSIFKMQVPDLGLREGQAVGVHIRSIDSINNGTGEVLGGVTLLIVG
jgi:hypothetical protein